MRDPHFLGDYLTALKASVDELKRMHRAAAADLAKSRGLGPDEVLLACDDNGRYILLDSLTAIVNAETALWLWR